MKLIRLDAPLAEGDFTIGKPSRGFMSGHVATVDMPLFQTPRLYIHNISTREGEGGSKTSIILKVTQDSLFEAWLCDLDQRIFSESSRAWKEWFGETAEEPSKDDFCSSIYADDEGNQCFRFYPGTTKANQTTFYDANGTVVSQSAALDSLTKDFRQVRVSLIITCCGIWMSNKRFGPRFKIHQVKMYK